MQQRLFVANFDESVTDDDLGNLFSRYGKVISAEVWQDLKTHRSRGFGFVEMADEYDAQNAIEWLNRKEWRGHRLKASFAQPDNRLREQQRMQEEEEHETRLFVTNFEKSVWPEDLEELFGAYGNVLRARVMRDENSVSRGFGFVEMEWEKEAERAIQALNGQWWRGRLLKVSVARPRR